VLESFPDDEDFESMADVMKAYGEADQAPQDPAPNCGDRPRHRPGQRCGLSDRPDERTRRKGLALAWSNQSHITERPCQCQPR